MAGTGGTSSSADGTIASSAQLNQVRRPMILNNLILFISMLYHQFFLIDMLCSLWESFSLQTEISSSQKKKSIKYERFQMVTFIPLQVQAIQEELTALLHLPPLIHLLESL